MNFLKHLFLPRFSNNQRARLIHSQIIFLVVLILFGSSFALSATKQHVTSVLGISFNIATSDLLTLTNQDRVNAGLKPLQLDSQLSAAAAAKAQDMFAKDYWAHYGPDGESPWDFIKAAGYNYVYAGENLARGFTTSSDVINAWMASPEHRANMLSPNYTDVGFAVAEGRLPGDNDTTLVVEEFGSKQLGQPTAQAPAVVVPSVTPIPTVVPASPSAIGQIVHITPTPTLAPVLSAIKNQPLVNSELFTKVISFSLLSLFVIIFGLDVVITENRKTIRLAGHSFDHLLFLIAILVIAISLGFGVIG